MLNHNKLRELREASGWTYNQLAQNLASQQSTYCSPQSLSAYEKGRIKNCSLHIAVALAKLYDVPLDDLLINI